MTQLIDRVQKGLLLRKHLPMQHCVTGALQGQDGGLVLNKARLFSNLVFLKQEGNYSPED